MADRACFAIAAHLQVEDVSCFDRQFGVDTAARSANCVVSPSIENLGLVILAGTVQVSSGPET